jgi:endonuclease YncB( thermonuclease family)
MDYTSGRGGRETEAKHSISLGMLRLKPRFLAITLLVITAAALVYPLLTGPTEGEVTRVIDGDTITVFLEGVSERVRLLGVDAPEFGNKGAAAEPLAGEAGEFVRRLLQGRRVILRRDPESDDRDRYGRLLRYVESADGTDVGAELLRQGLARAMTEFPCSRLGLYIRIEKEARESKRGIWRFGDREAE